MRRRSTARLNATLRVVVFTSHLPRVPAFEPKRDPVLVVHANAVTAPQGSLERLEPIAWRYSQVRQRCGGVHIRQFAPIAERLNHLAKST